MRYYNLCDVEVRLHFVLQWALPKADQRLSIWWQELAKQVRQGVASPSTPVRVRNTRSYDDYEEEPNIFDGLSKTEAADLCE